MKKINIALIVVVIVLILTCYAVYRLQIDTQLTVGLFASIIAVYFGYLKQKIANDKMFKDLFESFNNKYNEDINDLFNELRNPECKIDFSDKDVNNIIIDYFNLCAEEYLWYTKGRIPNKVWKAWKVGIIENINIDNVKAIYKMEIENCGGSYYGLDKELGIKI